VTLSAEFPNDNPDLHEGTIWVCLELTGAPVAERRPQAVVVIEPIVAPVFEPVVASLAHPVIATLAEPILPPTVEASVESPGEPAVEPVIAAEPPVARESGIFMTFSSLAEHGGAEEELDEEGEILVEELGPLEDAILEVVIAPASEPVIEATAEPVSTIVPPPPDDPYVTFVGTLVEIAMAHGATAAAGELPATLDADEVAQAWAGILRGTSEDWDAVGGSMLDEWAAGTLARVTGADAQLLKRELRARGVAAFGLAA
jgi:hypothetical protein